MGKILRLALVVSLVVIFIVVAIVLDSATIDEQTSEHRQWQVDAPVIPAVEVDGDGREGVDSPPNESPDSPPNENRNVGSSRRASMLKSAPANNSPYADKRKSKESHNKHAIIKRSNKDSQHAAAGVQNSFPGLHMRDADMHGISLSGLKKLVLDSVLKQLPLSPAIVDKVKKFVFFIGYPRSSHTLMGSLLDAHPHVLISNEYNLPWRYARDRSMTKQSIFERLYTKSRYDSLQGYRRDPKVPIPTIPGLLYMGSTYSYHVHDQWQGRFNQTIAVIGDKKGGDTTHFLATAEGRAVFQEMMKKIGIPLYIIHVVRNPFDNIATFALRSLNLRFTTTKDNPLDNPRELEVQTEKYFALVRLNAKLHNNRDMFPHLVDIHSRHVKHQPRKVMHKVCQFLELECSTSYLDACERAVHASKSRTRDLIVWPKSLKTHIQANIDAVPFLNGYTFQSD
ncbi:uncharacterized protein LOC135813450 [Sycon ciliatum]|uniref:uncharacterized protein LOC135813450 n=1 Tax=Sycon ciliatum TaxID=27933 RepID=UPI0031F6634B